MDKDQHEQNIVITGPLVSGLTKEITSEVSVKSIPTLHINAQTGTDTVAVLGFLITALIVVATTWLTIRFYQKNNDTQKAIANSSDELERVKTRVEILSKNRQDWINTLRNDLADYVATILSIYELWKLIDVLEKDAKKLGANKADQNIVNWNFKLQEERTNAERLIAKITLLANPREQDFLDLINAMNKFKSVCEAKKDSIRDECNTVVAIGQKILKAEWERVKKVE